LPVEKPFDGLEVGLVGHLPTVSNPVPQIQVWQPVGNTLGNLPDDVVGAETGRLQLRIVEGVNRGQPVAQDIEDADHAQHTVVGELDQASVHPALQQEMRVLFVAVLVHAAAGVPCRLVAQVKLVMILDGS
jgi:hypothetical protein